MKAICIIPARMASSRFPGKPLKKIAGLAMINHIYRRCLACKAFDEVVVATCDTEIVTAIEADGGKAVMTANTHERCVDRVSEAVGKLPEKLQDDDLVLIVQGDEILVTPTVLREMVEIYRTTKHPATNLITRLYDPKDFDDINTVKVVTDLQGRALYMSRSCIPNQSRSTNEPQVYQQTGIIAFKASFLREFSGLPQTPHEKGESCDMMRVIEHGFVVQTVKSETETIGVDTPADFARAGKIVANDPFTKTYL